MSVSSLYFKSIQQNAAISIQIWAVGGSNVDAADLALIFDPTLGSYSSFLAPMGWSAIANSTKSGEIAISAFDAGLGTNLVGASADGLLGTFIFTPMPGAKTFTASLNGAATAISDANGSPIVTALPPTFNVILAANATVTAAQISVMDAALGQTTSVTFTVQLSQALTTSAQVSWSVAGTSSQPALATDFLGAVLPSGVVTFAAGQTSQTMTVQVAGTNAVGLDRQFTLGLASSDATVTVPVTGGSVVETIVNSNKSIATISATNAVQLEGNSGTTPFTFIVSLDQAPVVAQTVNWSVVGAGANPAPASEFLLGVLPTGTVTFAVGQTSALITVSAAANNTVQPNLNFMVQLASPSNKLALGATTSATATVLNDDGASLTGQAYSWSSHALLSGVSVSAIGSGDPAGAAATPLELRNAHVAANGNLVADLWGNAATGAGSFDTTFTLPTGVTGSFTQATGLPSGWSVLASSSQTGSLTVAGFGLANLTGWSQLGSVSFALPAGMSQTLIVLNTGDIGATAAVPFVLDYSNAATNSSGAFAISPLTPDTYAVSASRSISDIGHAITAADALATLKLAVGLDPNPTIDGVQAAISPYELIAADVNGDGKITAADALNVLKMAVGLSTAPAASWIFVPETQTYWNSITGASTVTKSVVPTSFALAGAVQANTTDNLVGILRGDVNASWGAPAGSTVLGLGYYAALSQSTGAPLSNWGITALTVMQALTYYAANPSSMTAAVVADTAANVQGNIDALQAMVGKIGSIMLTDTPSVAITVTQFNNDNAVLAKLSAATTLTVAGVTMANAASVLANSHVASIALADSSSHLDTNYQSLIMMVAAGEVTSIQLTNGQPIIAITAAQLAAIPKPLALITSATPYVLDQRLTAAEATSLATAKAVTIAQPFQSFAVVDSAVNIAANLPGLEYMVLHGLLGTLRMTDAGTPVLSLTAAQVSASADVLSRLNNGAYQIVLTDSGKPTITLPVWDSYTSIYTNVIANIVSPFSLVVGGVFRPSAVASIETGFDRYVNAYTDPQSVSGVLPVADVSTALLPWALNVWDNVTRVSQFLDSLQLAAQAGKLASVTINSGGFQLLSLTQQQLTADALALSKFAPDYQLSQIITAAQAASPTRSSTSFLGFTVQDTTSNVIANLGAISAMAANGQLGRLRFTAASPYMTITAAQLGQGALALSKDGESGISIVLGDAGTPTVTMAGDVLSTYNVRNVVLAGTAGSYNLVVTGAINASTVTSIVGENGATLSHLTSVTVVDYANNLANNIAALQTLAAAGKLGKIVVLGNALPVLPLSTAQAASASLALAKIDGAYLLATPVNATTSMAVSAVPAQLSGLEAKLEAGTLTGVTLTDSGLVTLSLSAAVVQANILVLRKMTSAGVISIALTDGGTPNITVRASNWDGNVQGLLDRITSAFSLTITGPLSASTANTLGADTNLVSRLTGPVSVADYALLGGASVNTGLFTGVGDTGLVALANSGKLAGIEILNGGTAVLSVSAAQLAAIDPIFPYVTSAYTLSLVTTAAGAAAATANLEIGVASAGTNRPYTSVTVYDSAANITANLPSLEALALSGALSTITTGSSASFTLSLSAAQLAASIDALRLINSTNSYSITLTDAGTPTIALQNWQVPNAAVLGHINGSYSLVVSGPVTASYASLLSSTTYRSSLAPNSLVIRDGAGGYEPSLSQLETLATAGKIASLDFRGIATLSLTAAQLAGASTLLALANTPYILSEAETAVGLATATLDAGFRNFSVLDSVANVMANLPALEHAANAGLLGRVQFTDAWPLLTMSAATLMANADVFAANDWNQYPVVLTDAGTPTITLTSTQLNWNMRNDILDGIVGPYALTISGIANAAEVAAIAVENNSVFASLTGPVMIGDSVYRVVANLDALQAAAAAGKLTSIALVDSSTPTLAISFTQYANDQTALSKILGGYLLTVFAAPVSAATNLQADSLVASFSLLDSAANVAAGLGPLGSDSKLSSLTVTGTAGEDTLNLTGLTKAAAIDLTGSTASVSAGLTSPAMIFVGMPDALTLGTGASIVNFTLAPTSGIDIIANFQFGLDQLTIDLAGAVTSVLQASNTTVDGIAAISIYSSADPTHGIVLTGMTNGQTAADLLSAHTNFAHGLAIIT